MCCLKVKCDSIIRFLVETKRNLLRQGGGITSAGMASPFRHGRSKSEYIFPVGRYSGGSVSNYPGTYPPFCLIIDGPGHTSLAQKPVFPRQFAQVIREEMVKILAKVEIFRK